jgi:outer membrane receptor protein involved in Fe transport
VEYEDRTFTEFNPRLSLRTQLARWIGLRGAVYRAFRAPTLSDLYRSFASKSLAVLPNHELDPEIMVGGELGLDLELSAVRGQLNVFYAEVDNLIARSSVSFRPIKIFAMDNVGKTRSQGVELMLDGYIGAGWRWNTGYAYTDAVVLDYPSRPSQEGNLVPDVPEHMVTLGLRYSQPSGLSLSLRGRYVSDMYGDASNRLLVEGHSIIDASLQVPVSDWLDLVAIGENLLDEEYISNARGWEKLGSPRQIYAGVRMRFPRDQ